MNVFRKMEKALDYLTRAFAYAAGAALIFNVLIIVAYIARRAMGKVFIGTEEYVAMGQVILISMALGYAHHNRGLVHVGFFMKKLPGFFPMVVWTLNAWIATIVCVLWSYISIRRYPFIRQTTTMLTIPFKPFFFMLTMGVIVYTVSQLFEAVKCTAGLFNKEIGREIKDNWPS